MCAEGGPGGRCPAEGGPPAHSLLGRLGERDEPVEMRRTVWPARPELPVLCDSRKAWTCWSLRQGFRGPPPRGRALGHRTLDHQPDEEESPPIAVVPSGAPQRHWAASGGHRASAPQYPPFPRPPPARAPHSPGAPHPAHCQRCRRWCSGGNLPGPA
ncbi:hypothetical protein D187_001252 [Cystobacter fuscus DSM 2262]|uniref:Uncharacterized protein n=1 Tax=Cystobacter fuscus (strain ATCC 25194 / DSM 2262 / NBRC 100088 / M29) TaxID=1242864 RepID=S9QJJ5_CYSF2|nr:hypothetical protein D187_001252 [Cystobacter fuscus DSM 2262]